VKKRDEGSDENHVPFSILGIIDKKLRGGSRSVAQRGANI